ncbi:MAG: asparagine synthase (glutamine-hydrolyzing) [Phycisphaeraceae bacterium]
MCGILGVVTRDPQHPIDEARLSAARDTLAHRGPDEQGLWARPGVGLAHRRLSILDLAHGQQPWVDHDRQCAMVYNGEVYNYRALMRDAEQHSARFNTTCDTELVFHLLASEGTAALDKLNGMFALGYYDHAERSLLLVRDRLGQKPLYWADTGDALVFASELKAILHYAGGRYDLDAAAVEQFFTRGYVLSPRTIFRGIHKLPAGHTLTLDAEAWEIEVEPWWDAEPIEHEAFGTLDDDSVLDTLDELLSQSVADRLIADVPIGTLLSGGIDSSLITAMASKARGGNLKAFTVGFGDSPAHDETPFARMVAERYGCDWTCETIDQNAGDWLAELDDASAYYDEPFGNFTVTSQRTLSRLCREQLTVVLSGQGGDELSAGYPGRYNWVLQTEPAAAQENARSQYAPPVDDVVNHLQRTAFLPWQGVRSAMFSDDAHAQMRTVTPTESIAPYWRRHRSLDRLNNVLYTDAKTNLADYLICIEERASMSYCLEARNPMLDHRVVRYMLSLPTKYKVRPGSGPMSKDGLQNKWLLHALAKRYLPAEAFDRPKRGFTPPIQQWVSRYAERIAEVFRETDALTAPLYSDGWRRYLNAGQYEPAATMAVYYALVFALWARRYADHIGAMVGGDTAANLSTKRERLADSSPTVSLADASCSDMADPYDQMLHRVFREQTPEAVAEARWFCQALRNFAPGSAIRLIGDADACYRWLAEQSGLNVTDQAEAAGTVAIGMDAIRRFENQDTVGDTLLLFVPFRANEQNELNTRLQQINGVAPIQGHQAVPVGDGRGVLIARCHSVSAAVS